MSVFLGEKRIGYFHLCNLKAIFVSITIILVVERKYTQSCRASPLSFLPKVL